MNSKTDAKSEEASEPRIRGFKFVVGGRPFCVWDWNLTEKNLQFVNSLDPDYFSYLAATLGPDLETDHKLRAGAAIRSAYGLGLETLFAVLFASLQAPGCLAGWLHKYKMGDLRDLVSRARAGRPFLSYARLSEFTLDHITNQLLSPMVLEDKEKELAIKAGFAQAFRRFAFDFLDQQRSDEYNDLKHGFRVGPGGFSISFGTEHEYGVSPPADEMHSLGGSVWGSRSFSPQSLEGKRANQFWLRSQLLNWIPQNHLDGLQLISLCLANILASLRIFLDPEKRTAFRWPSDPSLFEAPWARSAGVTSTNFDHPVPTDAVRDLSDEEIRAAYRRPES